MIKIKTVNLISFVSVSQFDHCLIRINVILELLTLMYLCILLYQQFSNRVPRNLSVSHTWIVKGVYKSKQQHNITALFSVICFCKYDQLWNSSKHNDCLSKCSAAIKLWEPLLYMSKGRKGTYTRSSNFILPITMLWSSSNAFINFRVSGSKFWGYDCIRNKHVDSNYCT